MRFLVDEMFGADVARRLTEAGHDACHVRDVGLSGAADHDVLVRAVEDGLTVVTENAVDFVPLLEQRSAAGLPSTPVVIALKRGLPRGPGAMNSALADRLARWAEEHPDPYHHVHWLG